MNTFKIHLVGVTLGLAVVGCDDDASNPLPGSDSGLTAQPDAGSADAQTSASSNPTASNATSSDAQTPDAGNSRPQPDAAGSDAQAADAASDDAATADAASSFDGSCASLPGTLVSIESGDTQESLLKNLGRHLRDHSDITLIFNLTGSCTLINDIYTGAQVVPSGMLKYIPSTAEDPSWTPSMPAPTCTTGAEGVDIDLAISALFAESCALGGPPTGSDLKLIQGPIQAYTFVVPTASEQDAIWAEEAYYAFGFGAANPLAPAYNPWNQEDFMFIRPATKSTLVATAKNILLPPNKWKGVQHPASNDVVTSVINSTDPDATIGILGAEVYDNNRGKGLKTLAFQAFDQNRAYYPDSTSTSFDKLNVRDGHYSLWSPTVYITEVDGNGVATNPAVAHVLDQVLGTRSSGSAAPAGFDGLTDVIKVGLVPECAMQVTRSEDGGDLTPYTPEIPCTCFYLSHIPGATGTPAGCASCEEDTDCDGSEICSHGFCEAVERAPSGIQGTECFEGLPTTHDEIINACSDAQSIAKDVELPSNTLQPLP